MSPPYNVLFLCTGNSARSIMAEAILNHRSAGAWVAYSAGSHPSGAPRPEALHQLAAEEISTVGLRSKSWDEFTGPAAPAMNFIFTVCDNAGRETCPFWPGHPASAHWGIPDPAAFNGTPEAIARAFQEAFAVLDRRISRLVALPIMQLQPEDLQRKLERIGQS